MGIETVQSIPDLIVSGTITVTDSTGTACNTNGIPTVTGTSSSGSYFAYAGPPGASTVTIQVVGTGSGSYYLEYSLDSTTGTDGHWVYGYINDIGSVPIVTNTYHGSIGGSASGFLGRAMCSGLAWIRVRNLTGSTNNSTITFRFSSQPSGTSLLDGVLVQSVISTVSTQATSSSAKIGQVGGTTLTSSATPSVTVGSAYTAGNEVGGLLTFANAVGTQLTGQLQSIYIKCRESQVAANTAFKLYLFSSNPINTTWTDKTTPAISLNDDQYLIGYWALSNPDAGLGSNCTIWRLDGIGATVFGTTTTLYGVLITTTTPTFANAGDLTISIGIQAD